MYAFVIYTLTFLAGGVVFDLIHFIHNRYRVRQAARLMVCMGDPLETAVHTWAADPHYWCDRPGCPRCWGSGGNS